MTNRLLIGLQAIAIINGPQAKLNFDQVLYPKLAAELHDLDYTEYYRLPKIINETYTDEPIKESYLGHAIENSFKEDLAKFYDVDNHDKSFIEGFLEEGLTRIKNTVFDVEGGQRLKYLLHLGKRIPDNIIDAMQSLLDLKADILTGIDWIDDIYISLESVRLLRKEINDCIDDLGRQLAEKTVYWVYIERVIRNLRAELNRHFFGDRNLEMLYKVKPPFVDATKEQVLDYLERASEKLTKQDRRTRLIKAAFDECKENIVQHGPEELFKLAMTPPKYKIDENADSDVTSDDTEHAENLDSDHDELIRGENTEGSEPRLNGDGDRVTHRLEDYGKVEREEVPSPPMERTKGSPIHPTPALAAVRTVSSPPTISWLYIGMGLSVIIILVIIAVIWLVRRSSKSRPANNFQQVWVQPPNSGPPPQYSPVERTEKGQSSGIVNFPQAKKD